MITTAAAVPSPRALTACLTMIILALPAASPAKIDDKSRPIPAWPLIYRQATDRQEETDVLWPLFHHERQDSWSRFAIRPLLFSTESDPARDYRKTSLIWPLSVYRRQADDLSFRIFPLYWYGHEGDSSYQVLFPLYWDVEGRDESYTYLFPLYGKHLTADQVEYSTLYPFFRYRKSLVSDQVKIDAPWPLISYQRRGDSLSHRLLPLYWYHRDAYGSGGYFLLYIWEENQAVSQKTLFPIWHSSRGPEQSTDLFFPLFFARQTPEGTNRAITPLYWDWRTGESSGRLLLPIWYSARGPEQQTDMFFPLYFNHQEPGKSRMFITPLYTRWQDGEESGQALLPLWFTSKGPDYQSTLLLPLYRNRVTPQGQSRFITPLYWDWQTPDSSGRLLLPIWYSARDQEQQTDLILPLYYNHQEPGKSRRWISPLYTSWSAGEESGQALLPLWYSSQGPEHRTDLLLPLYYNRQTPESHTRLLTPLYLSRHTEDSSFRTLLPLYYDYQESDFRFQTILPLFYRYQNGPRSLTSLLPLYFHAENATKDSEFSYYFPIYGEYRRGEDFHRHLFFFPLYASVTDQEKQQHSTDLLWPLLHYETTPDSSHIRTLPLFWHTRDRDHELTVGLPLYWHHQNAETASTQLLPLYGSYRRGDWYEKRHILGPVYMSTHDRHRGLDRHDILFPLISSIEDGDEKKSWFFPFYYTRKDPNSSFTLGSVALLPPYYFSKEEGENRSWQLFPLYGETTSGDWYRRRTLLGGALAASTRDRHRDLSRQDLLFSLYSTAREGDSHRTWLAPFYYHREEPGHSKTLASLALLPPYYINEQGPDGSTFHLWPFYGSQTKGSYREFSMLWPLVQSGSDPERKTAKSWAFPFYYHRQEQDNSLTLGSLALLPPYYINRESPEESSFQLWPFYGTRTKGSYQEFSLLWPLIQSGSDPMRETAKSWVFPFYYHQKEQETSLTLGSLAFLPPYFIKQTGPRQYSAHLWPFYGYREKDTYHEHNLLWPLISFGADPEQDLEQSHVLLYRHRRQGRNETASLLPFWRHRTDGLHTSDASLFLHRYEHDPHSTHLSLLWLLPVSQLSLFDMEISPQRAKHRLFPLYSYESDQKRAKKEFSLLWPLINYEKNGDTELHTGFLWQVVSYRQQDPETKDFRILWRLIRRSTSADRSTFEINPLFYSEEDAKKGSYWALLGGLIGVEKTPAGEHNYRVLWFF